MRPLPTLTYGLLALPLAFAALPLYVHVPAFYANVTGLDLGLLGGILLLARLLDAGIDPWLGWLADRVSRRRMVAVSLLPFAVGFVALLNPPVEHAAPWLLASLLLTYAGFSAATVAYQAWGAAVGSDAPERTRLVASREAFGLLGVLVAAALPALLAVALNDGIARLAWVLPVLLVLAGGVTLARVGEGDARVAVSSALLPALRAVLRDTAFRRLLLVFICNGFAAAIPATLFLFFVADILQAEAASGPLLAAYFLAGAASLPLWLKLSVRIGRPRAWLLAMGVAMLAFAGAGLLGPGDIALFAVVCVASGLALGADLALPAALAADLGERQGRSGACFGVWNFFAKLNLALAAGIALPLLGVFDYRPGSDQGQTALVLAYALLPLLFKALAAILLWRWRNSLEVES
ncbi:MFS transporter [Azonexus hydrophilus]|uniref:MFS transporter n=1 Tax=Azonexus hydrophilus TaxID=418702 RepID=UPI0024930D04|nr:MFS transporter [Azonexus hydrophilus]